MREHFEQLHTAFSEYQASATARWDKLEARIDQIEAKANRQGLGLVGVNNGSKDAEEHRKAFQAFARKGKDGGLTDLEIKAALSTGSDPDGGYAVPVVIDKEIEKLLLDLSPMRRICNVIPITTPDYHKLVNVGGMSSGWVGEAEARPETNTPQLARLVPFMGEIYANPAATQQSLDDMGFDVEAFLAEGIVEEFAVQEGASFISGDGIKKPKGLLAYPTSTANDSTRPFGTLQHIVSGAADNLTDSDKLVDLVHSLRKPYRQGAVWLMNSSTLAKVRKLKDSNGDYLWKDALQSGQPETILGYPVEEDENMPDVGANALAIAFGNFKRGYTIVDRVGTRVLRDPFTNKPYVHFYATRRVGSFLNNSQAVKLLKIAL